MRTLATLLFMVVVAVAAAAPTVTARGTGGNNTSGASIVITPSGTIPAGSMAVLVLATDNSGTAGSTPATPSSGTDSVGNTWTRRVNPIYDPGAASAGVELAIYTSVLTTQLTTSDNLTLSVTTMTAKAWALWQVTPDTGMVMTFSDSGNNTGAASASPTVTTSTLDTDDVVIGGGGAESANTWTQDGDTSNGNWSSQQADGYGTGNSGMSVTSQAKVVTASATQTYNPTLTSADVILGWVSLRQVSANTSSAFFLLFQ